MTVKRDARWRKESKLILFGVRQNVSIRWGLRVGHISVYGCSNNADATKTAYTQHLLYYSSKYCYTRGKYFPEYNERISFDIKHKNHSGATIPIRACAAVYHVHVLWYIHYDDVP